MKTIQSALVFALTVLTIINCGRSVQAQSIQVYKNPQYSGPSLTFSSGDFKGEALNTIDFRIGSVKVPAGMMVTLFVGDNYSGDNFSYYSDSPRILPNWMIPNVKVKSLVVENVIDAALQAALSGPERKKMKIYGHEFNIKPIAISSSGNLLIVKGRISHHLSIRPDDQFDYTVVVDPSQDATIVDFQYTIDEGGITSLLQPILPTIASMVPYADLSGADLESILRKVGNYVSGDWQSVAVSLATTFAVKAGQDHPTFKALRGTTSSGNITQVSPLGERTSGYTTQLRPSEASSSTQMPIRKKVNIRN